MEEKVYERQVAKLSLSQRVVDEQQVNRYFSHSDLQELYSFTPAEKKDDAVPMLPKVYIWILFIRNKNVVVPFALKLELICKLFLLLSVLFYIGNKKLP